MHPWGPHQSTATVDFNGISIAVLPTTAHYPEHLVLHPSMRLSVDQDILQRVTAHLKSYEDLALTACERAELVSRLLLPQWCYKWPLVLNDSTMSAIDKKTRQFLTSRPGMCPKRNSGKVVTNKRPRGMGLHQVYGCWRTTMVTAVQSMLRQQLLTTENQGNLPNYTEVVTQLGAKVSHQRAVPTRTQGGPTLFDEEDTAEEVASHR